jgi:hypothetical protein
MNQQNLTTASFTSKVAGNIGGSLMSLGNKEKKNIKKLAKSVTHKVSMAKTLLDSHTRIRQTKN